MKGFMERVGDLGFWRGGGGGGGIGEVLENELNLIKPSK
jgi:hypothetical protein